MSLGFILLYPCYRQEKLELLANRFNRKAGMREIWLSENQKLVSQVGVRYDNTYCSFTGLNFLACVCVQCLKVCITKNIGFCLDRLC